MRFNLSDSQKLLFRTPDVLSGMLTGLPDSWVYANEGEDTWSPFDILGHLIHGERTDWIPRARMILKHGETKCFIPFDRFAQFEASQGKRIDELLDEFRSLRYQNLDVLSSFNLDEQKLDLTGIHPEFGRVTLRQLLATWVAHDLSHVNQISRVMTKVYRNEVGPWAQYISILNTRE